MPAKQPVKKLYPPQKKVTIPDQAELLIKGQTKFKDIGPMYFERFTSPIGIEVEVENFSYWPERPIYWDSVEDGSLKIAGREFVSKPVAGHNIDYAIAELRDIVSKNKDLLWSHRTSIHVHIDVGNFSLEKLKLFIAMYAVYESLFFSLVDENRRGNPYCYHLRDVAPDGVRLAERHGKYCAFNVGTGVANYNTVEFRHMHGTGDMKTIRRWIQCIVKLHRFVDTTSEKELLGIIRNLNTVSNYDELTRRIFGATAQLFQGKNLQQELEEGAFWAKVYLLGVV